MINVVEDWIELAISIFVYVSAALMTCTVLYFCQEPIIVQGDDKTVVSSNGVQKLYEDELYGRDILLMLLNSDAMTPYPKAIKINDTPVIKLDNSFLAYRIKNVSVIYSAGGQYKLSNMLDWKVTEQKYVYSGADAPYIYFKLEDV